MNRTAYYWIGRSVVEAGCSYELISLHSNGTLPSITALSARHKMLAWTVAAWLCFHLLAEQLLADRHLNRKAPT